MFPALTALAAHCGATGEDVLRAYVVGFEAGAGVGRALAGLHYEKGWHATSTIGVIAAAAAGGRLLGLAVDAASDALGLALAQASGMQASFGSDAKALQAGFAAAAAVRACLLAASGIGASERILDGPKGFFDLYTTGGADSSALEELGRLPPAIVDPGLEVKLYPICYAAHRAIEAALHLRADAPTVAATIAAIEIEGSPGAHTPLLRTLPQDGDAARFSVEYGVACALVDGGVGLSSFTEAMLARPAIAALMTRCRVGETGTPGEVRRATVRLRMQDGSVREHAVSRSANNVPDARALIRKVVDCLASVDVADEADALQALCERGLDTSVAAMIGSGPLARIRDRLAATAPA